jgi:hypothetical protein
MIGAIVALGLAVVLLAGALVLVVGLQARERQHWVEERRSLIDRAIAQHTGEVLALDRAAKPKQDHNREPRPEPVGLS